MSDIVGQNIVAVQFLNYLLKKDTIQPVLEFNIDDSYFPGYEKEFNYIVNHFYDSKLKDGEGHVPNEVRFAYDFPDFVLFEPGESINTIYHDLHEKKCYSLFVEALKNSAEKSKEDSFSAISYAKTEMDKLSKLVNYKMGTGTDIVRGAKERLEDYLKRIQMQGLMGITTGDPALDKALHGWLPEDLIVVLARTNEGKSWLLEHYGIQAFMNNKKVGTYSGEMGSLLYGYRFDSLYKHFSNTALLGGDPSLGNSEMGEKTLKEYKEYITDLSSGEHQEFRVFTQKDLEGKMNVNKMRILQDKYGFDMWCLDQLTLMDDIRGAREERMRLGNISEDCIRFSEEYKIPVLTVHQAGRKASEARKKDSNATPEVEDAFGADAIMQNATRGLSFIQMENGAKAKIIKNRYGVKGNEFMYIWNINYGVFKPMDTAKLKDDLF